MAVQEWSEDIWVTRLCDEPALSEDLIRLKDHIGRASRPPNLVIDLSGVTHLNSSNLSQLLRVRRLAVDRDIKLLLASPPDHLWALFLTTGLDKVFEFSSDVSTALAGLQMKG
jgi:anti-anti-sigma factor